MSYLFSRDQNLSQIWVCPLSAQSSPIAQSIVEVGYISELASILPSKYVVIMLFEKVNGIVLPKNIVNIHYETVKQKTHTENLKEHWKSWKNNR